MAGTLPMRFFWSVTWWVVSLLLCTSKLTLRRPAKQTHTDTHNRHQGSDCAVVYDAHPCREMEGGQALLPASKLSTSTGLIPVTHSRTSELAFHTAAVPCLQSSTIRRCICVHDLGRFVRVCVWVCVWVCVGVCGCVSFFLPLPSPLCMCAYATRHQHLQPLPLLHSQPVRCAVPR